MRTRGKKLSLTFALSLVALSTAGQLVSQKARFEAATIKAAEGLGWMSAGFPGGIARGPMPLLGEDVSSIPIPMPDPGRVVIRNINLLGLIAMAYGTPTAQIRAPGWLGERFFTVEATVPPGTPKVLVRGMLQSLVNERFGLVIHNETKEVSGYALVVAKGGPNLTPTSAGDEQPSQTEQMASLKAAIAKKAAQARSNGDGPQQIGGSIYERHGVTLQRLAGIISNRVKAPVVDMTGLKGTYDVKLQVSSDDDSIFSAVGSLGLKLISKRVPADILVVDRVEKSPIPN